MHLSDIIHLVKLPACLQCSLYHRLRVEPQREALDRTVEDLEMPAMPAQGFDCKGLAADRVEEPARPLEDRSGSGKPFLGQLYRKDRVAAGVGEGTTFPQRHIADARLVEGIVGRDAEIEGLSGNLWGETQCFRCRRRACYDADRHVIKASTPY